MSEDPWKPFDGGRTIGTTGSEGGVILADDEIVNAARISLERETRVAPFAITCGIYYWMMHTRWFSDEAMARRDFDAMKEAIDAIVTLLPLEDDPDRDERKKAATRVTEEFVERFP